MQSNACISPLSPAGGVVCLGFFNGAGYSAELHVGVRSSRGKLVALITAVPTQ